MLARFCKRHAHFAQRGIGIAYDGLHLGPQVETRAHFRALIELADIEEGAEEIAAVVGGAFGGHLPDAVGAHLAVRLEAGDDVEREVGEAELLDAIVGADPHPALYGHVVADQPDVHQLDGVGAPALDHIELEGAGLALGLVPGDAVEQQLGIDEIGAQVHPALAVPIPAHRHLDADIALHQIVDVEPQLGAIAVVEHGGDAQRRLLVGGRAEHVLPARLGDDAVDEHLALGFCSSWRHIENDISAVHLVGPQHVAEACLGDARPAFDFEVARLQRPAERQGNGELGIDLALDAGRVEAALLQELEGLAVEHLERNGQRPLAAKGDMARSRQRLLHIDSEGALEAEAAAVGNGERGFRDCHLQRCLIEP